MATIEFRLVPPTFHSENAIRIEGARNILVEFQKTHFNNMDYSLQHQTTTIVTGANGSGKSIYLRNMGNIIYLAQIGCYVPCQSVQLPLFDRLLTKFNTNEDVSQMVKSHFYQEASDIKDLIESCNGRSLVLIDEYAQATSNMNGLALFMTLVETFTQRDLFKAVTTRDDQLPTVVISTNLRELFTKNLLQAQGNLKVVEI